jgi:Transposase
VSAARHLRRDLYKWKAKYWSIEASDAKRLRALEDENRRLKKLSAESMLDNVALKDILGKRRLKAAARRLAMAPVIAQHGFSQRHACRLIGIDHSTLNSEQASERRPAAPATARAGARATTVWLSATGLVSGA